MIAIAGAVVAGAAAAAAAAVLALRSSRDDEVRPECGVAAVAPSQECAVCLSDLVAAGSTGGCSEVRMLAGCGHGFHEECIGRWLRLRPECPLCRCPVPAADGPCQPTEIAVVAEAPQAASGSWPARIACGFGDGRVVWTRSPSVLDYIPCGWGSISGRPWPN